MSSNPFIETLFQKVQDRYSVDSQTMSVSDWVCKNTTLRGKPFTLKEYHFQQKILDDMHPNLSCIKLSQCGMTEVSIRKILAFLARNSGTNGIYSLPTEEMYLRISNGRIKTIVDADKVFNTDQDRMNKATRRVDMMQFGKSFLYITPANEQAATSISADIVFNDETDLSDQKMLTLFNSRLQNSKWKISQRFSTPSFPSFGIDLDWQSSDQHLYMRRCGCCGRWVHPEFTRKHITIPGLSDDFEDLSKISEHMKDDIDLRGSFVHCEYCKSRLDLSLPGDWAPSYGSRKDSRGYRITPFCTENLSVEYIVTQLWRYQKTEYVRGWHNTVLGLPYTDGSIQIPEADIKACMTNVVNPPELSSIRRGIYVGIDMGQTVHITIGTPSDDGGIDIVKIYNLHVNELVQHMTDLEKTCNILGGCIDRHPYTPTSEEVMVVTKGKVLPVEYRGLKDINLVYKDDIDGKVLAHAQVNHTWFLDQVSSAIKRRAMKISGYGAYKTVFIAHLRDMVRDEQPDKPAQWVKLTKNDHFFHSTGFMLAAPKIFQQHALTEKTEVRTMVLASVVPTAGGSATLFGGKGKPVERIVGRW